MAGLIGTVTLNLALDVTYEVDELVVVNRGLEPAEVVQLMDGHWMSEE